MNNFDDERSATGRKLRKFGDTLRSRPHFISRSKSLIFLCGASVNGSPSPRRKALQKFIHELSGNHVVIYAEGVFSELQRLGDKKNVLDLEHEISDLADKIVFILESESAFCELGAFASKTLRKKLVVINSSEFKSSQSFINEGPLAAAAEVRSPVLWYPMKWTKEKELDGIGAIFGDLSAAIAHKLPLQNQIDYEVLAQLPMTKSSLYFIHDLVCLTGPVSHEELIFVLKVIFPATKSFDSLKNLLGILREGKLVHTNGASVKPIYHSNADDLFLRYTSSVLPLMSAFRNFHLQKNPERFYVS